MNITESGGANGPFADLVGDSGVSDDVLRQFASLSIARFREASARSSEPATISDGLKTRKLLAQAAVGWIWGCVAVFCFLLVLKLAIWQAWLWPGPKICCTCWMRFSLAIWFFIFAAVFLGASAGGGLPGLIIIVIIIVIYLLILKIVYCCRSRHISSEDDSLASHGFSRYPIKFGSSQNRTLCIVYMLLFFFFVAAACTVKWWDMRDYVVWNRDTGQAEVEYIKPSVATAGALVYSFDGYANKLNINDQLFKYSTALCGIQFGTVLNNDAERKEAIYDQMIVTYNIDMSIYVPSDYRQYNTVNEWFIRSLKMGVRPIYNLDPNAIVSPADSRVMTFATVPTDLLLWIKGEDFTVSTLLGPGFRPAFDKGPMALCRLAPQDYHRFHSPVSGVIVQQGSLAGSLYAVNADGMTSGNNAIYNQRHFTIIETPNFGNVAVVAIGATCVGSIVITQTINATVQAGQELGYFQFGGSTVAVVFEAGRVQWDADLRAFATQNVESFTLMGSRLGVFK